MHLPGMMKMSYLSAFKHCLNIGFSVRLLINIFCLTGFLGPFTSIVSQKPYAVASLAPGMGAMQWPLRKAKLQQLDTFSLKGHIEVRSHHHKGINLAFKWDQNLKDYRLKLLDEKGQVLLVMNANSTKASLNSHNKNYSGKDAERLLAKHLEVPIPLSYFKDWLRGIPSPNIRNERVLNPTKHLLTLNQGGWFIRYLRYHKVRKIDLPTQLFMIKKDWHVRVLITHWGL